MNNRNKYLYNDKKALYIIISTLVITFVIFFSCILFLHNQAIQAQIKKQITSNLISLSKKIKTQYLKNNIKGVVSTLETWYTINPIYSIRVVSGNNVTIFEKSKTNLLNKGHLHHVSLPVMSSNKKILNLFIKFNLTNSFKLYKLAHERLLIYCLIFIVLMLYLFYIFFNRLLLRKIEDVTNQKNLAEHELKEINSHLSELVTKKTKLFHDSNNKLVTTAKEKSEYLENMGHKIRTPINSITGMCYLLLNTSLNNSQRYYTNTIQTCGETIMSLLNDILDLSKIESNKLEVKQEPFKLRECIDDCIDSFRNISLENDIKFNYFVSPEVYNNLIGDAGKISQVLINLISNAIKYTTSGEISIKVSNKSDSNDHTKIIFKVRDTGVGIKAEDQDIISNYLSKENILINTHHEVVGTSLMISKNIVTLMGGKIQYKANPAGGSEFSFSVNLKKQKPVFFETTSSINLLSKNILILDTDLTNGENLKSQLESWGATVDFHPEQATILKQKSNSSFKYSIILIDELFEKNNLEDFIKIMRDNTGTTNMKIIIMSKLELKLQTKVDYFLPRPISYRSLHDCFFSIINKNTTIKKYFTEDIKPITQYNTKVLLVDDDIINQIVAQELLTKLNLHVDMATNGEDAIKLCSQKEYNLIFMDIKMPNMDGILTTKKIRKLELNIQTPIIAMTADPSSSNKQHCIESGMNDFITKPVIINKLKNIILQWANYTKET